MADALGQHGSIEICSTSGLEISAAKEASERFSEPVAHTAEKQKTIKKTALKYSFCIYTSLLILM